MTTDKAAAPVGAVPQLPPLPDAELDCHGATTVYSGEYFTADQMRAYAKAALASQAARMGESLELLRVIRETKTWGTRDEALVAEIDTLLREAPQGNPASIKSMVARFLGWPLPKDFSPDHGIAFTPPIPQYGWPTGTNLLTADQAKAMFEYCAAIDKLRGEAG